MDTYTGRSGRITDGDVTSEELAESKKWNNFFPAIIHYNRPDGDYDGWGLHVWDGFDGVVQWSSPLTPTSSDDYGIIFTVPLVDDATKLGFIIHKGNEKDLPEDRIIDFSKDGREASIKHNKSGFVQAPQAEEEDVSNDKSAADPHDIRSDE